jgi:hypothetical protein
MLILIAILVSLGGCTLTKQQRKENRETKKAQKYYRKYLKKMGKLETVEAKTGIVRIDTIILPKVVEGATQIDTVKLDSIITQYITDTVEVETVRRIIQDVYPDSIVINENGTHARIFLEPGNISWRIWSDTIFITKTDTVETFVTKQNLVHRRTGFTNFTRWFFFLVVIAGIAYLIIKYWKPIR